VVPASTTPRRRKSTPREGREALTVAVTGASGTIGPSLLSRLSESRQVGRVIALGRHRTPEMEAHDFRAVDVRDGDAIERAVAGADVVVHMAFALYGLHLGERDLFATNVLGTTNVARAAARAGARRFVYTSSAAVYGTRREQPEPIREDEPLRPNSRLFYARHKAQAELTVTEALAGSRTDLYMFRPCAIVGPHATGAGGGRVPAPLREAARWSARAGLRPLLPPPPVPLQYVHEDDVAQAVALAVEGQGRPGTYNLAGEGSLSAAESLRMLGFGPLPVPGRLVAASLRALALVPPLVPAVGWPELVSGSLLVDTGKARRELGWQPRWTSEEALRSTREALGY
jgi:nucleoside-diphosphate-sugar epimerase